MGTGKIGSFFLNLLSFGHETTAYEEDPERMRFTCNCQRFTSMGKVRAFQPELIINAVMVRYTVPAFEEVMPCLSTDYTLSDISSVKTGLKVFHEQANHPYVSMRPMFGPTFASLNQLNEENTIIISEGDYMGRTFFKDLYQRLGLHIYGYTFEGHGKTMAYSLSVPFVSTFVFATVMKHQDAPGTTFKRHARITKGVLNKDDYLLQEILLNPYTYDQVSQIQVELGEPLNVIDNRDAEGMKKYLTKIRQNMREDLQLCSTN